MSMSRNSTKEVDSFSPGVTIAFVEDEGQLILVASGDMLPVVFRGVTLEIVLAEWLEDGVSGLSLNS